MKVLVLFWLNRDNYMGIIKDPVDKDFLYTIEAAENKRREAIAEWAKYNNQEPKSITYLLDYLED